MAMESATSFSSGVLIFRDVGSVVDGSQYDAVEKTKQSDFFKSIQS